MLCIHLCAEGATHSKLKDIEENVMSTELENNYSNTPSRGLVDLKNVFIPKGEWNAGGSISYYTHTNDSYKVFVIDNINSEGYSFKISPMFTYSYADNRSIGARLVYERTLLRLDNATLSFGEEDTGINISVTDFYSLSHTFSAQAILRQYIPIGQSKRFAIFNEVQLGVGGSQSKFAFDSPVSGTYSTGQEYSLGLSPGIIAFASNKASIEVSVGVMGLSYSHIKQVHNQVTVGDIKSHSMNFKVNLLSIGFGLGFNIF